MAFGEQGQGFRNQPIPFFEAGNTTVINSLGTFIYNGTPGLGTLISSDTPPTTTGDGLGNSVLPGMTNYFNTGSGWLAVQILTATIAFSTAASSAGPWTQVGEIQYTVAGGASYSVNNGQLNIISTGGNGPGQIILGNNGVQGEVPASSGFLGGLTISQTDATATTVTTATALTRISKAYPIPAGSVIIAATHYRLKFSGQGQMGAVAVGFSFTCGIGGTSAADWDLTFAAPFNANDVFSFQGEIDITVSTIGATANWILSGWILVNDVTTGNSAIKGLVDTGNTHSTLIAESAEIDFQWAAVSAGRTITCLESSFERITT